MYYREEYFIIFPNGDKQPLSHSLQFGEIVDINGNVYPKEKLDPKKIAYRVSVVKNKIFFKERTWYYKLELLKASEVNDEIFYYKTIDKKIELETKFNDFFKKLEKKHKNRKKNK